MKLNIISLLLRLKVTFIQTRQREMWVWGHILEEMKLKRHVLPSAKGTAIFTLNFRYTSSKWSYRGPQLVTAAEFGPMEVVKQRLHGAFLMMQICFAMTGQRELNCISTLIILPTQGTEVCTILYHWGIIMVKQLWVYCLWLHMMNSSWLWHDVRVCLNSVLDSCVKFSINVD